ncbi:alpha/beta hydrolase [Actinoalloteichus sp. GBA129-24]|uniref:alpha/beta hydrolase n=1 Tax=Actinoalloteichus sp. GBA129-24 TaxID=1612551 RepID=UPI000950B517|nr:alpha/beta hydrolase [Actinoalloteichus sp. GBA129-24]APU21567.1 putative hydrolase or acyltransferase of alpha/beta superfamily [Actinoalloteichus sp. GBA129-24]
MAVVQSVASVTLNSLSRVSAALAGRGAYRLMHMPFARSSPRQAERERMGTAHIERMRVGAASVVTYRWGSGERPVLLVHGWQSRGSRLTDLVPGLLDQGHSVITFDAPGHGDSTGRSVTILDYREIITRLQDRYGVFEAIVAHSMGVLGSFDPLSRGVQTRRFVSISGVCDFTHLVEEFCSTLRLRAQVQEQMYCLVGARLFPDLPADRMPFSVTHAADIVSMPVLVIHDEQDDLVEHGHGLRIAAALGDRARLVTTNGLGHRRILGDGEVIRTVLDFVNGGEPQRTEAAEKHPTAPLAAE